MTIKEMEQRLVQILKEAEPLAEKANEGALSSEEDARFDELVGQANEVKADLETAKAQARKAATLRGDFASMRESRGTLAGMQAVPGAEEREHEAKHADRRSLGQRFAESEQITEFRNRGGRGKSQPLAVGSFYHRTDATYHEDMGAIDRRALVTTGGLPADYISPQQVGGFFRGDDLQGSLRDVLINGTTTSDAIVFFRELLYTNNAAGVAQATATTGTSGLKPESAITFEQDTAPVVTIAHWIPITRQTLQDAAQIRTYVEQRLIDGLRQAEADQLLNGTGTPDLDGILGTTGIQYLDNTASTGYWATNALPSAGADRENFDRILHAKTVVRVTGRAMPNFVVLNPADLEKYLMTVDGNNQYYGAGPFGGTNVQSMWGLRVVENEHIAEGEALVGDGRMAAVWDRMQAQILVDTIDDQFVRNMLTLLAEERVALTVFRPAAFAHVELAAW